MLHCTAEINNTHRRARRMGGGGGLEGLSYETTKMKKLITREGKRKREEGW